jgi:hypothetical protein
MTAMNELEETTREEYRIMYREKDIPGKQSCGFRIDAVDASNANGFKLHLGKVYSGKALLDILRRNFGPIYEKNLARDNYRPVRIVYDNATFCIDSNCQFKILPAVQNELFRNIKPKTAYSNKN